jgi:hypothetical protein
MDGHVRLVRFDQDGQRIDYLVVFTEPFMLVWVSLVHKFLLRTMSLPTGLLFLPERLHDPRQQDTYTEKWLAKHTQNMLEEEEGPKPWWWHRLHKFRQAHLVDHYEIVYAAPSWLWNVDTRDVQPTVGQIILGMSPLQRYNMAKVLASILSQCIARGIVHAGQLGLNAIYWRGMPSESITVEDVWIADWAQSVVFSPTDYTDVLLDKNGHTVHRLDDLWSLGVMVFGLVTRGIPFSECRFLLHRKDGSRLSERLMAHFVSVWLTVYVFSP